MVYRMELVNAKVPNDILDRIEDLEEREDITRSEAVRRLLRQGIDQEQADQADHSISNALGLLAALLIPLGLIGATAGTVSASVSVNSGPVLLTVGAVAGLAAVAVRREIEAP